MGRRAAAPVASSMSGRIVRRRNRPHVDLAAPSSVSTRASASHCSYSCAGGLGGCPYAKSATGNLATEDLVWQLHGLGVATGIDLPKLVDTSVWMAEQLGRPSPSRTVTALAGG
jgi:hypothetical protein